MIPSDIKADNILMSRDNNIRISDFGVSYLANSSNQDTQLTSDFGSPYWMAPEVIEMRQPQTPKSDIWSVGCLTLEIFTGVPPYFNLAPMSALYHICADATIPIEDPNHNITQVCYLFLQECFQKDPAKRPSAAQLLNHPWFEQPQPQDRISLETDPEFASPQATVRKPHGVGDKVSFGSLPEMKIPAGSSLGSLVNRSGKNGMVENGRNSIMENHKDGKEIYSKDESKTNTQGGSSQINVSIVNTLSSKQPLLDVEEVIDNIDYDQMADELSEKITQDMEESKLLSSLQVVTEASRRNSHAGDLPTALRTLRQAIVERGQVDAVVRNGGLYPLVSCALMKVTDEETSLLTLQVELGRR